MILESRKLIKNKVEQNIRIGNYKNGKYKNGKYKKRIKKKKKSENIRKYKKTYI